MFSKVLVANRGAIACRIVRTLRRMGVRSVAVYSEADRHSLHVEQADEAVAIGPAPPAASYLSIVAILEAACRTGAQAIHPGYGFLSENAAFAEACEQAGIVFIGPTPDQMRAFGLKHTARAIAAGNGVPLLPGTELLASAEAAIDAADRIGYPVMLKSTAGGGGIGMRLCGSRAELGEAFGAVERLSRASFGTAGLYLEKFVTAARHIEVQIFGDGAGCVIALGERDCSAQRRNQKVIEETPAPGITPESRATLLACAIRLGEAVRYRNAGTVEFIYDNAGGAFYFLEVNTRLQVEHGVTEEVTGVDLVEWMVRQAAGEMAPLDGVQVSLQGASLQVRLYAEDPAKDFQPGAGRLAQVVWPRDARVETWVESGSEVTPYYDPMLAKIIVRGADRAEALARLRAALAECRIAGIETNLEYLRQVCADPVFAAGGILTAYLRDFPYRRRTVDVIEPGTQTTVQDYPGRIGHWHVGVPPSGPMDALALRVANRLVGNPESAAGLEIAVTGPTLCFACDTVIALTGADFGANLPTWQAVAVKAGDVLEMSHAQASGSRAYLAIAGGFDVPEYLGSRSTFILGRFGGHAGRVLAAGDVLQVGQGGAGFSLRGALAPPAVAPAVAAPVVAAPVAPPAVAAPVVAPPVIAASVVAPPVIARPVVTAPVVAPAVAAPVAPPAVAAPVVAPPVIAASVVAAPAVAPGLARPVVTPPAVAAPVGPPAVAAPVVTSPAVAPPVVTAPVVTESVVAPAVAPVVVPPVAPPAVAAPVVAPAVAAQLVAATVASPLAVATPAVAAPVVVPPVVAPAVAPPLVAEPTVAPPVVAPPEYSNRWEIGVLYGPHGAPDFFTDGDIEMFFATWWKVHYNSDRTGVRLIGPKPKWARKDGGEAGLHPSNIHDNAYAIGTVDFTGDMPVILGPDGPSLGGFVCPATIVDAELWKIGQLRPGDLVRFRAISLDQARALERDLDSAIATLSGKWPALPTSAHREQPIQACSTPSTVYRADGDKYLLVEYGPNVLDLNLRFRVHALEAQLRAARLAGVLDITPGVRSLHIHFDGRRLPREALLEALADCERRIPALDDIVVPSRVVHLPLSWDDPATQLAIRKYMQSVRPDAPWCPSNIEFIRRINGLASIDEVRRIVFDASYLVLGLGDVYLGAPVATPTDPRHRLVTTKYNPARTWTPENAVGIGGAYMCVYGMEGPGGYQFVGRTVQMWNTYGQGEPWLLRFFDRIRFTPVSAAELLEIRDGFPHGRYPLAIEEQEFRLKDYHAFLRSIEPEAAACKRHQQEAFEAERERWAAAGADKFVQPQDRDDAPAAPEFVPEGCRPVRAPVTASVWNIAVEPGQRVEAGQKLIVLEAMKMEIAVSAPTAGTIEKLNCAKGALVSAGQHLITLRQEVRA